MKATPLEEALRADPEDLAAWRAYSDVLLEQGDVRRRLIELKNGGCVQRGPATGPRPALPRGGRGPVE